MTNDRDHRSGADNGARSRNRRVLWIVLAALVLIGVLLFLLLGGDVGDDQPDVTGDQNGAAVDGEETTVNGDAGQEQTSDGDGSPAEAPDEELEGPVGVPPTTD